jgi:hypothetical protein
MKSEGMALPAEVTNLLGKSPHEYFQAGMEMVNHNTKKNASEKKGAASNSIEF